MLWNRPVDWNEPELVPMSLPRRRGQLWMFCQILNIARRFDQFLPTFLSESVNCPLSIADCRLPIEKQPHFPD